MIINTRHSLAALLLLAACNPDDQEPGELADSAQAEDDDGQRAPPELPCGDVNLWTDDMNCGACGNVCEIMWPGTPYEAGHCVEGECGPIWSPKYVHTGATCGSLCGLSDCAPLGCSGLTAIVCLEEGDPGDKCDLADPHDYAHMDLTVSCAEALPDPAIFDPNDLEQGADLFVRCCCERFDPLAPLD